MKKVFTIISVLIVGLNYTKGQSLQNTLRLNEIAVGANNTPSDQFIELYNLGQSFSDYKIISRWEKKVGNTTTAGFYVLTINNLSTGTAGYVLLGGSTAGTAPNRYLTFSSTNLKKYDETGNALAQQDLDILGSTKIYVFLVKGTKIMDLFAAGNGLKAVDHQEAINKWPSFMGIDFKSATVNSYNNNPNALGSNASFSLMYENNAAGCSGNSLWVKTSTTPYAANVNGSITSGVPNFPIWETTLKTYKNSRALTNVNTQTSANIPADSYSVIGPTNPSIAFQYFISNTNISPVSLTNPALTLYYDVHATPTNPQPDGLFDTNDPQITSQNNNLSIVYNATIDGFLVSFDVTPNMVYDNPNTGKPIARPFFLNFTSSNLCNQQTLYLIPTQFANLPVTFGYFKLNQIANNINIKWQTLSEQNNKGFEIQRSIGSTNQFQTIGFVGTRAKDGNSQTEISYSFEDADVKAGQTHYYRLNQIDFDGKSAFSAVKSIKPGSIESNLNVYPNPSQGSFTVNTGSNSGKLNIFLMDNTGRVVNQFMNVSTSNTRINNLKKGFYTLKIVNTESGEQSAQRVVVQ
jgi:hypothetical protein